MNHGSRTLQIDSIFWTTCSCGDQRGARETMALRPMTVAAFYQELMAALDGSCAGKDMGDVRAKCGAHCLRSGR